VPGLVPPDLAEIIGRYDPSRGGITSVRDLGRQRGDRVALHEHTLNLTHSVRCQGVLQGSAISMDELRVTCGPPAPTVVCTNARGSDGPWPSYPFVN
jgi:hypothetical protein